MTLSQEIAQILVAEIAAGVASPGGRLDEISIAKRFNVSRTPVREALRYLAATQLVEYTQRRGFSVAQIDRAQLQDGYEAFTEIESLCARLCALRAGMTERLRLKAIHEEARTAADRSNTDRYALINNAFHDLIYAGAHNKTLEKIALDLRQQLAPFRSKSFIELDQSQREHEAIVKAILAKNSDAAAAAMTRHTSRVALIVLNQMSGPIENPLRSRLAVRAKQLRQRSRRHTAKQANGKSSTRRHSA